MRKKEAESYMDAGLFSKPIRPFQKQPPISATVLCGCAWLSGCTRPWQRKHEKDRTTGGTVKKTPFAGKESREYERERWSGMVPE